MSAQNGSGEDGTATLTQTPDGVQSSLSRSRTHPRGPAGAHSRRNLRQPQSRRPQYLLTSLANGTSTTVVKGVTLDQQLTSGTFAINVHKSTADLGTYVSCGDIKTS